MCQAWEWKNQLNKKNPLNWVGFQNLALQPGLEPGTCGLTVRRSTNWAIRESVRILCITAIWVKRLSLKKPENDLSVLKVIWLTIILNF